MENVFAKIAVVGSGALGCYYGAMLARSGVAVTFLVRSDLAVVRERGLRVKLPTEEFALREVRAQATPEEIGPCDLVIVALKTTANGDFRTLIAPLLHERTAILTLQNGLGSDEELARLFGAERVMGGLCFICVNRTAPGEVLCIEPGSLSLGEFGRPVSERLRAVGELFTRSGVRCQLGDDLAWLRWKKLVWNVPFNGLSIVAGGITTDVILADAALEAEVRALMAEVIGAAGKLGYAIPMNVIDQQIAHTRPMGPYKPSSLIDYLAGRAVEVEEIWGEPLRRAQAVGAQVPRMAMLYALLGRLTKR
ncbi:2-dehydropantoate 2-reductase [Nibricoccus aquaticus]|uniref:2-dehydropantoate 2-reductase n=1 Tax=Nibricoccus aquaticus TaxID=2576891 RepID=A0A290QB39_9BACT|nr:2-dehydropantoate 2-reductase [Nibricoccus aquaticus]ATC64410.1 2-dehydropantoate 2-reductase [Nibricoccus aquaticus]